MLIDDLIAQYGPDGILSIDAYNMGAGPDDWRYVVTINGEERPDLDVRSLDPLGRPAATIVDDQGRDLVVWATPLKHPNRFLHSLSELPDIRSGAPRSAAVDLFGLRLELLRRPVPGADDDTPRVTVDGTNPPLSPVGATSPPLRRAGTHAPSSSLAAAMTCSSTAGGGSTPSCSRRR